jgi:hypothetical protein
MNPLPVVGGAGLVAVEGGAGSALVDFATANPISATVIGLAIIGGTTFCVNQAIKSGKKVKFGFKGFGFEVE